MTKKELAALREQVHAYSARLKAKGIKMTAYLCPGCKTQIETRRPKRRDVDERGYWDTMTACPECGHLHMLQVFPSGQARTITTIYDGQSHD